MKFSRTRLRDVWVIDLERHEDERGFFARTWCQNEFAVHGLNTRVAQCSSSFNRSEGTLRGMHSQAAPHEETKIVRCTRGAIYDVVLDLRAGDTFGQWVALELTAENGRMVYIPEGVAHGFQTLLNETEVLYQMSEFFHPECAKGIRWNDPRFSINWPYTRDRLLSPKDAGYRDYE